jgi:hypothetical protein
MGTDQNAERDAINSLLEAQQRWSDQTDEIQRLGEGGITGFTFGPWFLENGEAQLRVLLRAFDVVDVWRSLSQPALPEGAEAERDHLITTVAAVDDRQQLLDDVEVIVSERHELRARLATDYHLVDPDISRAVSASADALKAAAGELLQAVGLFANRVGELNARMSMRALQVAADRQGVASTQMTETRGDDGSLLMGVTVDLQQRSAAPRAPWWRFWRR